MSLINWVRNSLSSAINQINNPSSESQSDNVSSESSILREKLKNLLTHPESQIVVVDSQFFNGLQLFIQGGPMPQKALHSTLLTKSKKLKKGLQPGKDYFFIYESLWKLIKAEDEETIFPDIHKKILKTCHLVEDHISLLIPPLETSRADPTDLRLPTQVPRNEHNDNQEVILDEIDLKDGTSTNFSSIANTSSEGSMFGSVNIRKGKVGLENPGLFCYLNSGIQCLLSATSFVQAMVKMKNLGLLENKDASLLLATLITTIFKVKNGWTLKTGPLRNYIKKFFAPNKQHDMPELFRFLINSIENELGPGNLLLTSVFNGILCSTIYCTECESQSKKEEVFIDLQVELSETLEKSLESFTRDEMLSTGYLCVNCKKHTAAIKSLNILRVPNCLCIQIKRFKQEPNPHKSTSFIKYRRRMAIQSLNGKFMYELLAVGVHIGSMSSGHYVTYGKRYKSWYCFDDAICNKVDLKRVLSQTAYMLVYKLMS